MKMGEGMCKHYGLVEYDKWFCHRCSLWFLRCPKCKPIYCPPCIDELNKANNNHPHPVIPLEGEVKG